MATVHLSFADPVSPSKLPTETKLSPRELLAVPGLRIIDIREPYERQPPVGYVPTSRLFPMSLILERPILLRRVYPLDAPIALTCMTGRRTAQLVPKLQAQGFQHVYDQDGGIFGWADAGLPLAGQEDAQPDPEVKTFADAVRAMESCFVAAAVESDLDNDTFDETFNPRSFVTGIVTRELNRYGPTVAALEHALDHLAEEARLRGHELEMITRNLDHMRSVLAGMR